jgi:hypothetical protein
MAYTNKLPVQECYRTLIICVDDYENRKLSGRLLHSTFPQHKRFDNLMQLLLLIEQTVEENEYPCSSTQKRVFKKNEPGYTPPICSGTFEDRGKLATFRIRILFRQNASWQGTVCWVEGGCEETFRSALELIYLIDNASIDSLREE